MLLAMPKLPKIYNEDFRDAIVKMNGTANVLIII